MLSIEEYGTDANGEPIHTLVLSARANHSNFPECKTCRAGRLLEEDAVSRKAPLEERQRCRQLRQMHRAEYRTERTQMGVAQKRANESQSGVWLEDDSSHEIPETPDLPHSLYCQRPTTTTGATSGKC